MVTGAGASGLGRKGLFVIGCPRSGTTVLQDALNHADAVFLFGEPDFHDDPGTPDFARRYNEMHRSWRNQRTKSTYCPALFEGDACWSDYLAKLSERYRYVGAKIVLNPELFLNHRERILRFYTREFYDAHFVFTFRHPLDVAAATQGFQRMLGFEVFPFERIMANYVAAVGLYVVMLRNLPRVQVVFHDRMTPRAFSRLERFLGVRLQAARRCYSDKNVRRYDRGEILRRHGESARLMVDLYREFQARAESGFELPQLAQCGANPSPTHHTPLGRLARRCELLSGRFGAGEPVWV